jgi:hypothetical protein
VVARVDFWLIGAGSISVSPFGTSLGLFLAICLVAWVASLGLLVIGCLGQIPVIACLQLGVLTDWIGFCYFHILYYIFL